MTDQHSDVSNEMTREEETPLRTTTPYSIRMVIQRYRKLSLLVDEKQIVTVGATSSSSLLDTTTPPASSSSSLGLLAYVSFAKTADAAKVEQAAKTLLHLPIGTLGAWGDGSTTQSLLQLAKANATKTTQDGDDQPKQQSSLLSIALVPQANLIARVKKNGKSIQYHDQIEKSQGKRLYDLLVETVQQLIALEQQSMVVGGDEKKPVTSNNKPTTPDPSIPPNELFRDETTYSSWDENGLPLSLTATGDSVTKSARKKLQKLYYCILGIWASEHPYTVPAKLVPFLK
jgi:hypothetical protein